MTTAAQKIRGLKNLIIPEHPVCEHNLTAIRDKDTCCEVFRISVKRISNILLTEATKNLKTKPAKIQTPLTEMYSNIIDPDLNIIISPILRAGLIFSEAAAELLPMASVQHIGMYRDEVSLTPVWYFDKTKANYSSPENTYVYILDPMLATGNSACEAIGLFLKKQIPMENITFVSLISSVEGLIKVSSCFEEIKIVTACVDESLNDVGFIVPGLGDAGDRLYNTMDD